MPRYRIEFDIRERVLKSPHPLMLDSVLAKAKVREMGIPVGGDYKSAIDSLPLKKIPLADGAYVYAASMIEMHCEEPISPRFDETFINRSYAIQRFMRGGKATTSELIGSGRSALGLASAAGQAGPWKNLRVDYGTAFCISATAVFESDQPDEVMRLLQTVECLGKKSSIGYGKIRSIDAPVLVEDDTPIVRPLPAADFDVQGAITPQRVQPPYWMGRDRVPAGIGSVDNRLKAPRKVGETYTAGQLFTEFYPLAYKPYGKREVSTVRDFTCAMCGVHYTEELATPIKSGHLFSGTFGEYIMVLNAPESPHVCKHCEAISRQPYIRIDGAIVWNGGGVIEMSKPPSAPECFGPVVGVEEAAQFLINPPEPPFFMAFTAQKKKHSLPLAVVNYSRERFIVTREDASVEVVPEEVKAWIAAGKPKPTGEFAKVVSTLKRWMEVL